MSERDPYRPDPDLAAPSSRTSLWTHFVAAVVVAWTEPSGTERDDPVGLFWGSWSSVGMFLLFGMGNFPPFPLMGEIQVALAFIGATMNLVYCVVVLTLSDRDRVRMGRSVLLGFVSTSIPLFFLWTMYRLLTLTGEIP